MNSARLFVSFFGRSLPVLALFATAACSSNISIPSLDLDAGSADGATPATPVVSDTDGSAPAKVASEVVGVWKTSDYSRAAKAAGINEYVSQTMTFTLAADGTASVESTGARREGGLGRPGCQ